MIFAPYPGSADFRELVAQGKVKMTEDYTYLALARSGLSSKSWSPVFSTRQLIFIQYSALLVFYATAYLTRPWRAFGAIRSLFTGNESTQLDQLLRTKLRRFAPGRNGEAKRPAAASEPAEAGKSPERAAALEARRSEPVSRSR